MHPMPGRCPVCNEELTVTQLHCRACDTTIAGHFSAGAAASIAEEKLAALQTFARLTPEQLAFLETFIKNEGKITRVEEELGISYPTVRARLSEVIRALGHQPREDQQEAEERARAISRREVLRSLAEGRISSDEAARLLRSSASGD
ncbi:MAG: DUF2089 domain-containing protein [Ardenticatenaceae bacterium]|nr:DUF2089 domain-containing protein [Ardenticatenaceae bacterium]HBY94260.1 hypothetical protein [Chloroflexota bacterium]